MITTSITLGRDQRDKKICNKMLDIEIVFFIRRRVILYKCLEKFKEKISKRLNKNKIKI